MPTETTAQRILVSLDLNKLPCEKAPGKQHRMQSGTGYCAYCGAHDVSILQSVLAELLEQPDNMVARGQELVDAAGVWA